VSHVIAAFSREVGRIAREGASLVRVADLLADSEEDDIGN